MRYWSSPSLADLAEAEQKIARILAHSEKGDLFQLTIERRSDKQMIGTCTLHQIHLQNRRAEVGYALSSTFGWKGLPGLEFMAENDSSDSVDFMSCPALQTRGAAAFQVQSAIQSVESADDRGNATANPEPTGRAPQMQLWPLDEP